MDMKSLLDQMLQSGKEMAQKGQTLAEEKLNVPAAGAERDTMLSQLKVGAEAAGVLAMLLGTDAGRRVTGAALKVGSVAALGGLAYQMYNKWQGGQADAAQGATETDQPAAASEPKASAEVLLKAMIAAAKADGHVDAAELAVIRQKLGESKVAGDVNELILSELTQPLSAKDIAALANQDKAVAAEIYVVSALVIDQANEAEKAYLTDLKAALQLPDDLTA